MFAPALSVSNTAQFWASRRRGATVKAASSPATELKVHRKLAGAGTPNPLTPAGARDALVGLGYKPDGLVNITAAEGFPVPLHNQSPDTVEFVLSGTWDYTFNEEERVTLQPGDAVELPAGVNHRVTPSGSPVALVTGVQGGTMADLSVTWVEDAPDPDKMAGITMEPVPAVGA